MRISQLFVSLAASSVLLAGCTNQEDPARQSVAQGEAALADVRERAAKYAPDELKVPEATLAKFKQDLANEDYKAVLDNVPKFNNEMKTLNEAVLVKETAFVAASNEWQSLAAEVPKTVAEIENRVKNLNGSRLPKEVAKENFEAAKANLEPLKAQWAEATAAAESGKVLEAADKARQVKQKAEEMKTQLAMNPV
jgi:uncharacterized lipoprotein NlpE involved in copper resistance